MAGAGFESGLGAVGELAFGAPELKIHRYLDILDTAQGEQAQALRDLAKRGSGAVNDYAAAIAASNPQIQALGLEDIGTLGDLAKRYSSFDPDARYASTRSGDFGALKDLLSTGGDWLTRADKIGLSRTANGGVGGGHFWRRLTDEEFGPSGDAGRPDDLQQPRR